MEIEGAMQDLRRWPLAAGVSIGFPAGELINAFCAVTSTGLSEEPSFPEG